MRNPVVQAARGILPDEVSNWEGWISSLNIYRDRIIADNNSIHKEKNWIKSVKSLLLAKLSNVAIDFSEGETIEPFSDIASSDNESVCRFIDCIDDIEEWLSVEGQFKLARPQSEALQPPQSFATQNPAPPPFVGELRLAEKTPVLGVFS